MPSEMTLNLRLTGMIQMIGAIRQLNLALQQVNNQFKVASQNINAAANNIVRASNSVRSNRTFVGPGGGRGGNSASPSSAGFNQQDLGSMVFSGFAGAWNILQAKIWTRVSTGLAQKFLGNHPLNPNAIQNQHVYSMPINAMKNWEAFLKGLAGKFLLVGAVIMAAVAAIKLFIEAVQFSVNSIKQSVTMFWTKGGPGASADLEKIGAKLNMSPEEVASNAASTPGGAKAWIARIKQLSEIAKRNPEAASYIAEHIPGGTKALESGLSKLRPEDFKSDSKRNNEYAKDSLYEWNQVMGELKKAFRELGEALAPLVRMATHWLKNFTTFIEKLAKFLKNENGTSSIWNPTKPEDKMKKAADQFDQAVDKFTDKVGTFGGGERGKNAIPRAWTWQAYTGQLRDLQDAMGAFEF